MSQLGTAETLEQIEVAPAEPGRVIVGKSPGQLFWMRFRSDRVALAGLAFIVFLVVLALTAPLIARFISHHGPNELFRGEILNEFGLPSGPNGDFWFGSDRHGHDLFVRVIYGTRTSLLIAVLATMFAVAVGVLLGMTAGFFRGWADTAISRAIDIMLSMPLLLFAIGIVSTCSAGREGCFGGLVRPGVPVVVFVIALFSWPQIARLVRGQTLSIREREFIEASRVLGASNRSIMLREVLPNLVAPIIVYATLIIPTNIIFAASLSYLGLGVSQAVPDWGRQLAEASQIFDIAWWTMLFPGLFLFLTTLAFNLVGDGLRDALDPRTKARTIEPAAVAEPERGRDESVIEA